MVCDLLNFTTDRQPENSTMESNEFAESLLQEVLPQCEAQGIQVQTQVSTGHVLQADHDMLRRALRNLILNSVDAMTDGGSLELRIRDQGTWCLIEVQDSGPGISADVMDRLFDPFVTTKDTGTGLGLSIVERIVEAHGGRIGFRNCENGGALFSILLPIHHRNRSAATELNEERVA